MINNNMSTTPLMLCPFAGNYTNGTSEIDVTADGKVCFDGCQPYQTEVFIAFEDKKWTLKHMTDKKYIWKLEDVKKGDVITWIRGNEKVVWTKVLIQVSASPSPIIYSASPQAYSHSPSPNPQNFSFTPPSPQLIPFQLGRTNLNAFGPTPQPLYTRSVSPQPYMFASSPHGQPLYTRSASPIPMFMSIPPSMSPNGTTQVNSITPVNQKVHFSSLLQVPSRTSVSSLEDNNNNHNNHNHHHNNNLNAGLTNLQAYDSGSSEQLTRDHSRSRTMTPEPKHNNKNVGEVSVKQTELPEYRRRQVLVKEMHDWVAKKLQDVLLPEEECLRGERVLFIPCKSPKSLNNVQLLVNTLLDDKRLQLTRASLPFSRKNQKQFKGFLLYLEFATMDQVKLVRDNIFPNQFGKIFQKCVVAPPRPQATNV